MTKETEPAAGRKTPATITTANTIQPSKCDQESTDLKKAYDEAMQLPVDQYSPDFKKGAITQDQLNKVFEVLSSTFGIPKPLAVVAVILLFLKGAASGTPPTLSVTVGNAYDIAKRDLLNAYTLVTNNKFLRRMAEAMALQIGQYAEKNGLRGELAQKIETAHKAETGEGLTAKELAWCSSFNQHLDNLPQLSSERVAKLLAADYTKRFEKRKTKEKKDGPPPPAKGDGKSPNSNKKNQKK